MASDYPCGHRRPHCLPKHHHHLKGRKREGIGPLPMVRRRRRVRGSGRRLLPLSIAKKGEGSHPGSFQRRGKRVRIPVDRGKKRGVGLPYETRKQRSKRVVPMMKNSFIELFGKKMRSRLMDLEKTLKVGRGIWVDWKNEVDGKPRKKKPLDSLGFFFQRNTGRRSLSYG